MIQVSELTKHYGSTVALDRLSLEVPSGSVFGLLGPNGAGKTTLLRLVMGFAFPDSGRIDREALPPAGIGYLPERAFYPPRFTVREYLATIGRLAGLPASLVGHSLDQLLRHFGLHKVAGRRLAACSRGMLQRLGLAQALLGDPPLVLMDEPARGLDPAGQKFMRDQVLQLHSVGKTVILSSHHLDHVTRTCTHVGVLHRGRLVLSGELLALLAAHQRESDPAELAEPADPRQVAVVTSPLPAELIATLTSLAPGIVVSERGITLSGEAVSHKAQVLRLLLDAQVDIHKLTRQHVTLEDIYLEVTRG
jgi:ABC-2 type transport system ATP-binding protein